MGVFSLRDIGQTPILSPLPVLPQSTLSLCAAVGTKPPAAISPSRQPSSVHSQGPHTPVFSRLPQMDAVASQPLECVPTKPVIGPLPCLQPTPEDLLKLGIKLRDFAHEKSSLPPVPVVRRPIIRELKRARDETGEEREWRQRIEARRIELTTARMRTTPRKSNNNSTGDVSEAIVNVRANVSSDHNTSSNATTSAVTIQGLQRQRTEPVVEPSNPLHLDAYSSRPHTPWQQLVFGSQSQSQSQSQTTGSSQLPPLCTSQTDSEMDDEYVKTPLVSPNGSLVYMDDDNRDGDSATLDSVFNASELPESQVEPLLGVYQNPAGENDVSAAQMGFPESQSQSQFAWQQESQSPSLSQQTSSDVPMSESDRSICTPTRRRFPLLFKTPSPRGVGASSSPSRLKHISTNSASPSLSPHHSLVSLLSPTGLQGCLGRSPIRKT